MARIRSWYGRVAVRGLAVAFATALPFAGAMVIAFNWDRDPPSVAILTTSDAASAAPDAHSHNASDATAGHDSGHEHDTANGSADGHSHRRGASRAHSSNDAHSHAGDGTHDATHDDRDAPHAHDVTTDSGHAHDPATTTGSQGHGHPPAAGGASHPNGGSGEPGSGGHDHPKPSPDGKPKPGGHQHPAPTGPIISLDDSRVTPAQRAAAKDLITRTTAAMVKAYPTVAAVVAGGYRWIKDGVNGGYRHYVNWTYLSDGRELDPARIESIVTEKKADGSEKIVSAMYILTLGKTMADVPKVAGELTTWHDHKNLCWNGQELAGRLVNGKCTPGGTLAVTPPMLHVWMVAHPCGPFAGIEGHGKPTCGAHNH